MSKIKNYLPEDTDVTTPEGIYEAAEALRDQLREDGIVVEGDSVIIERNPNEPVT